VLRRQLSAGYLLLDEPALRKELEGLPRDHSPEAIVADALKDAMQRMRRLALEEVQRTLDEAEPHVRQLPPTPAGRALLCTVAARRAHVANLLGENAQAAEILRTCLSADPDFSLDQAREPPPLIELLERVRAEMKAAPTARIRVTTKPPGATVVYGGVPLGRAPQVVSVPADTTVVLWAVLDGHLSRNAKARTGRTSGGDLLSIEVQLDPISPAQRARPLIQALREAAPAARPAIASALCRALEVEAVVLAQVGPGPGPRLLVYGAPPRFAGPGVPAGLDLMHMTPAPRPRRGVPPWLYGLIGAAVGGAVTAGLILGFGPMR
jgi:hypothetical protein